MRYFFYSALLFILIGFQFNSLGQSSLWTNQYLMNPLSINPAYAAENGDWEFNLNWRQPRDYSVSVRRGTGNYNYNVERSGYTKWDSTTVNGGVGAMYSVGEDNNLITSSYALNGALRKLMKMGYLHLGASFELIQQKDEIHRYVGVQNEYNVNVGVLLNTANKWNFSVTYRNVFNSRIDVPQVGFNESDNYLFSVNRGLQLFAQKKMLVSKKSTLTPSTFVALNQYKKVYDINLNYGFRPYSLKYELNFIVSARIREGMSYAISWTSNQHHEIPFAVRMLYQYRNTLNENFHGLHLYFLYRVSSKIIYCSPDIW